MKMKLFKLLVHQKNFREESLLINSKDWPQVQVGDILEIYLIEDEHSRLLLQVSKLTEDFPTKDTISIEQSIANSFHLRTFAEVVVNKVSPKDVALDSVEFFFKDQYLSRSDMWRIKQSLVNTCVYSNKKIEYFGIRCQVYEMWSQGERVACGVVTEDTKVVYRSASSMVYLFIQMSSEMWDFDINGDLYFEKAINGFLSDLFAKWKKLNCNHDVTIVLFSRTFYEASNIEEFPTYMRECLQQDYKGRFFEDFYRVAVQNERYEDWSGTLKLLKKIFNQYAQLVLEQHKRPGVSVPRALNATSSQGNFLEVLNMSLNVFEKHYMDRSFDRTGQLSVVISPGVGVFEVDRDLTNVTKQRIIDNGIGSDLVCLGEQPLHAVPLFKFYNKQRSNTPLTDGDNYNMPHWINLSFYCSTKHINYSNFVPRIKLPTQFPKAPHEKLVESHVSNRARHASQPEHTFPSVFDYDDYDAQVFKLPSHTAGSKSTHSLQRRSTRRKSDMQGKAAPTIQPPRIQSRSRGNRRSREELFLINSEPGMFSSPSSCHLVVGSLPPARSSLLGGIPISTRSGAISIPHRASSPAIEPLSGSSSVTLSAEGLDGETQEIAESDLLLSSSRAIVGSAGSPYEHPVSKQLLSHRPRALINPFDPSHVTIKLTSNRRRWTHVFPLGPTGIFMQQHHYQAVPQNTAATLLPPHLDHGCHDLSQIMAQAQLTSVQVESNTSSDLNRSCRAASSLPSADPQTDRNLSWLWGATGEQEWTSALTTGVDWKSLVIPACLPITTDYFPDDRSLQLDYLVVSHYTLLPEYIGVDLTLLKSYSRGEEDSQSGTLPQPPSTLQVCKELLYQRLQQGFQLVILPKEQQLPSVHSSGVGGGGPSLARGTVNVQTQEVYLMSIGRIYHKITLEGQSVTITQFGPKHPYPTVKIHYCYRFRAPDNESYGISWVDFVSEKLENYNWNHLDHYVCQRGLGEFELRETLKFWRLRLLLLPSSIQATKRIMDNQSEHCHIYQESGREAQQREHFLRFLEILNGIRRTPNKRIKMAVNSSNNASIAGLSLAVPAVMRLQQQQQPLSQGPRRFSLGTGSSSLQAVSSQSSLQQNSGDRVFRERVGSTGNRPVPTTGLRSAAVSNSKAALDRVKATAASTVSGRVSPATSDNSENRLSSSNTSLEGNNENENEIVFPEMKRLAATSPRSDIVEAMTHPEEGLTFVRQAGLPPLTFLSTEAVSWMQEHMEGLKGASHAVSLLQKFMDEDLLKHASGDFDRFIPGSFFYTFVGDKDSELETGGFTDLKGSLETFQREWIEVEVVPPSSSSDLMDTDDSCALLEDLEPAINRRSRPSHSSSGESGFRLCTMNLTGFCRNEWSQLRYQSSYQPGAAFELILEWMVASPNIVAELVLGWARKVTGLGFHLVPIPRDPFALPFSSKSDPLRGPIFIPLNLDALIDADHPTAHFTDASLFSLQREILARFGFILQTNNDSFNQQSRCGSVEPQQYVHVSGSFFVIILPNFIPSSSGILHSKIKRDQMKEDPHFLCSPHEDYITRHFSGVKTPTTCGMVSTPDQKVGFLWSWNYMITKRWKTQSTGDDHFIHKVLHDFRSLCANRNDRLLRFWENHLLTSFPTGHELPMTMSDFPFTE